MSELTIIKAYSRVEAFLDNRRSFRYILMLILALAALLRLWHIQQLHSLPLFEGLLLDSQFYDKWGQNIASGNWLGSDRAFYMDPLYPYFLGVLYWIFGHDILVVRVVQAALGVATCLAVGIIGKRVGGRSVGLLSALLMALYRPAIFNECEIEKTALGLCLVTLALAFSIERSIFARFGAGCFIALATLTRGNLMAMIPLGAIFFIFEPGSPLDNQRATIKRVSFFKLNRANVFMAAMFMLGVSLVFAPVFWRNYHVSGDWVITTSQAGTNFYIGNNPENASGGFWPLPFVRLTPLYEEQDFRDETESRIGRRLTSKEISAYWFNEAFNHIKEHPKFAATVFMAKFILFWSNEELPDGWDINFLKRYSSVLRLPLFGMGVLVPFALLGVITANRRDNRIRLLLGFTSVYCASVVAFYIFSRYRIYVVPALAVFAGMGLKWYWDRLRQADYDRFMKAGVAIFAAAIFSFFGVQLFASGHNEWSHNYIDLAVLYEQKGEYATALSLLNEAQAIEPERLDLIYAIGRIYQRSGNHRSAIEYLSRSAQIDESFEEPWYLLGVSYEALNDTANAIKYYKKQIVLTPDHKQAIIRLSKIDG